MQEETRSGATGRVCGRDYPGCHALRAHRAPVSYPGTPGAQLAAVICTPSWTDILELLAPAFRVDMIAVELRLAPDLPCLWADPHQLQQVLVNLLTNAQQALRDVAVPRRLTLTTLCDSARTQITLEVEDNGPGMPPGTGAHLGALFHHQTARRGNRPGSAAVPGDH